MRQETAQEAAREADSPAWRWDTARAALVPVTRLRLPHLDDLVGIERQKAEAVRNTAQFVAGRPANNALLWGARGTGKSTLVRALLGRFAPQGLRMVAVDRRGLEALPEIVETLAERPGRWIVYCDDLAFEAHETGYLALKSVLEGGFVELPSHVLVYATSNRRHLLPEPVADTAGAAEIHPDEAVDARISLADRFGLWLSFPPFDQTRYLEAVRHWLARLGAPLEPWAEIEREALRWAMARGSRSGRTAWQFARDLAGQVEPPPRPSPAEAAER